MPATADAVFASLVGSAIGDALGLPYENLSARRAAKLLGEPDRFRLFFSRGMVSDDAEHACMTCAAFAASGGDVDRFRRDLARRLRWWIVTVPPGVGLATLKSTLRLWLGISPKHSGVWSAGNGPAMRAAILGRLAPEEALFAFVEASTLVTHRDPLAIVGAYAVAVASALFAASNAPEIVHVQRAVADLRPRFASAVDDFTLALDEVAVSLRRAESTVELAAGFCRRVGLVSGYILETVPVALHAAFSSPDAIAAIRSAIACGGDTDSVASIAGGIVGLSDPRLLARLIEWPCDEQWLRSLANTGAAGTRPPSFPVLRRIPRNALLLSIVLAHVARRCLPPY